MRAPQLCVRLALALVGASFAACSKEEGRNGGAAIAPLVESVQARSGALPLIERLSGTVVAENQVALFPEVEGRIAEVLVENGSRVEAGQPLVRLREDVYREQLRQAEAGHRINEARLRQAEARLKQLESEVRRTRELGKRDLVTQLELETGEAQLAAAQADVDLARAQLDQSAATVAEQRDLLAKTTIRSPIAGVVGQRNAEIGMQASPSTRLFTVGNLERVKVRVNLTDTMLRHISVGQPARIYPRGENNGQALEARLTRISPFLDEVSRSTVAEIEVPNPDQLLRAGMFVPVDIGYGESRTATIVPTSALYTDPNTGRTGLFVVTGEIPPSLSSTPSATTAAPPNTDGTQAPPAPPLTLTDPVPVEFRSVEVIASGAMEVAVDAVRPGDWVVTLGQDLLSTDRQEARVRAVTWDHVLALQGMRREDLLQDVLRTSSESPTVTGNP